nr:MAG: hypothetical protein [Microvirus sp.]
MDILQAWANYKRLEDEFAKSLDISNSLKLKLHGAEAQLRLALNNSLEGEKK